MTTVTARNSKSFFTRLLHEISWEGNGKRYRVGGRGFENVLTAEVFQALHLLPRGPFLGKILETAVTGAPIAVKTLGEEAEDLTMSFLPGDVFLAKKPSREVHLQPDVTIRSHNVHCFVEAKRIKSGGSFQSRQLAREYLAVIQEARVGASSNDRVWQRKLPLLLLVVPDGPLIPVKGHGKIDMAQAISSKLEQELKSCEHCDALRDALPADINSVVAYTTWAAIEEGIKAARADFEAEKTSLNASVCRLAETALNAIDWHSFKNVDLQ